MKTFTFVSALAVAALTVCISQRASASDNSDCIGTATICASTPWPQIYGRVGAFDVSTPADVDAASKAGLQVIVGGSYPATSAVGAEMKRLGMHYIDTMPQYLLYKVCGPQVTNVDCSPGAQSALLKKITAYVQRMASNDLVMGYWILDDYPGRDIRPLLESIHDIIAAQRPSGRVPALCGFGGRIDYKKSLSDPSFIVDTYGFDYAATNFDSKACDVVALYPYGGGMNSDPRLVDWSMTGLLPHILTTLRGHGWDQHKEPLVAVVQTFSFPGLSPQSYVSPRGQDVETQAAAYCKAGAIALIGYDWNDSFTGTKIELYNSADLRSGLIKGAKACGWALSGK